MTRALSVWLLLTLVGCLSVYQWTRIDESPSPSADATRWAWAVFDAARNGQAPPNPPQAAVNYRGSGPIVVSTFRRGRLQQQIVSTHRFERSIRDAAQAIGGEPLEVVISIVVGEGPLGTTIPILTELGVVPLREGILARMGGKLALLPPAEMRALNLYDGAVPTPLPELSFGTRVDSALDYLARQLGTDRAQLEAKGEVRRVRAVTLTRTGDPDSRISPRVLTQAARDGAEFLLRHQKRNGRYTYIYDARTGREQPSPYNMPRHAGTTYFLAQMARLANMPSARDGAIRALKWTYQHTLRQCGAPESRCVESDGRVDVGSAALTAVAATEVLKSGEVPWVREMLLGLTTFLRSMQRPDGELMHVYDLQAQRPVDVQLLYYSGEAAFALLNAHRITQDPRDLEAAKRLMAHLTGAGWSFFGSRYYYGEEHWTCLAVGEAADRVSVTSGVDFCERWTSFNRAVQYDANQTPWPIAGTYGVGPLFLPRLTPVASRTEAAISVYETLLAQKRPSQPLKRQIEAGLGALLRFRWAPGPTYLFMNPADAFGGMTGSPSDWIVRNDFVQHAGSAMIRWAQVLERERSTQ